ncbi:hypothetical protein [Alicyclobacillus acidoterrestris]|uniref:Uncharacterized protein n=1 Tax=Alicyclobacillus acidoterrestris (strain ATCC 49025 / DSM 3922 / CIP 106132 / NCIMB 13137 / GD3B) TaxID=1356854 RepID=T0C3Q1_ALIAG|nr:hypothetical protein [Alicyclobacillus acidoterrestris]EPZ47619.1 hypothetical protein N007_05015 [Alicyclobacillus acidoterrestris ATCC 49025]UNO48064.1 hypothetical protein K1I37_15430 [Alicyclobacillus acidoterrestris]
MIYYTSSSGTIIGGTSGSDLTGITHLPSGADYAIYIDDAAVSAANPNNLPGTYTITNIVAGQKYTVPTATGTLTFTPLSEAEQLALAQTAQSSLITQGYNDTLAQGFVSFADGTSRTYPADSDTIDELLMLRSVILANQFPPDGVPVLDAAGTHMTFNQTQADQLITDAQNFVLGNRNQKLALLNQIAQAQSPSDVQAIVWTPTAYTPLPAPTT